MPRRRDIRAVGLPSRGASGTYPGPACNYAAEPSLTRPLIVILATVMLDGIGIGLIFPILPRLLEEVTHATDIAPYVGVMSVM
jgi:hypothetical protein